MGKESRGLAEGATACVEQIAFVTHTGACLFLGMLETDTRSTNKSMKAVAHRRPNNNREAFRDDCFLPLLQCWRLPCPKISRQHHPCI